MKKIIKGHEPRGLAEHRSKGGHFDDVQGEGQWKAELKEALLRDQGGICCYCMARISDSTMKVEHFRCQDDHPDETLDYRNLLAACMGGEGHPPRNQHCDTRKRNAEISLNPTGDVERIIRYLTDGSVAVRDSQYDNDLEILNLNLEILVRSRKQTLSGIFEALAHKLGKREAWTDADLGREINRLSARNPDGNFIPFAQVGVYLLKKRLGLAQM
jgi:uncharacterized protein (TIGR02646 family)